MANPKILIVDDSVSYLSLLKGILGNEQYTILIAKNLFKAYKVIQEEMPDLILLDLLFPTEHGFTILKKIRANATYKSIPVIIISADNNSSTIKKAFELGANDFLAKPLNLQDLKNKVYNIINNELTKNNQL